MERVSEHHLAANLANLPLRRGRIALFEMFAAFRRAARAFHAHRVLPAAAAATLALRGLADSRTREESEEVRFFQTEVNHKVGAQDWMSGYPFRCHVRCC
jgi:hypothetical protein